MPKKKEKRAAHKHPTPREFAAMMRALALEWFPDDDEHEYPSHGDTHARKDAAKYGSSTWFQMAGEAMEKHGIGSISIRLTPEGAAALSSCLGYLCSCKDAPDPYVPGVCVQMVD